MRRILVRNRNVYGIMNAALFLLAASAHEVVAQPRTGANDDSYKLNIGLETFGRVYREIAEGYIDEIDPEPFIQAGIQAMLEQLDPYTVYNVSKSTDDTETLSTGSYTGIGISVNLRDSAVVITDVTDGYSAYRAGVRIGDEIIRIDSIPVRGASLSVLRKYIRGKPNTSMNLMIRREGEADPVVLKLKREIVSVRSAGHYGFVDSANGIGYIRLDRFGVNAGDETRTALIEMLKQRELKGLVFDLRGNPGGLLEAAVEICSKFVPYGSVIVSTRGRDASQEKVYKSEEDPVIQNLPLVVLVDNNSASASEIVAGAIQDLDAGIVLGTPSFGKGLVQSVRQLPNDATLKLTTARYYTPSGRCVQKIDYRRSRFASVGLLARKSAAETNDTFHTRSGRNVVEGVGIQPDSIVWNADTASLTEQLRRAGFFFKYANKYTAKLNSLPDNFTVSDSLLRGFEEYTTTMLPSVPAAGGMLSKAKDMYDAAMRQHLSSTVLASIQKLQTDLTGEYRSRMVAEREDLRRELGREITGRYISQAARNMQRLVGDKQVNAATSLLISGKRAYSRLLGLSDHDRADN